MSTSPRIAVVTGAGSGIGRAVAVALLAEGYHVALAGRRAEALDETAALAAAGDRALTVPTDVTQPDGMFLCAQGAFRVMKAQRPQGGRIVNNGSISAMSPRPDSAAYVATKHGVSGLSKSLALDGRAFDIACGQIDIGNAVTPLTERMPAGAKQADGRMLPEPRMDVAHVARAVVFMASLPLDTNVLTMTIMATKMPFVGRG